MILDITATTEFTTYMLTISGFLIMTLLTGIGYFLRQFASTVNSLRLTVEQLKIMLSVEQEKINSTKETVSTFKQSVEQKIITLIARIDLLDREVNTVRESLAVLKAMENEHHNSK